MYYLSVRYICFYAINMLKYRRTLNLWLCWRIYENGLIELRILLAAMCDGFCESGKNSILSTKLKILFMLEKEDCSPRDFIDQLCIAKSNIAGILKKMNEENLTECYRLDNCSKNIFYKITNKGKLELNDYKNKVANQLNGFITNEKLSNSLIQIIDLIKGQKND